MTGARAVVLVVAGALLTGCAALPPAPPDPIVRPAWQEVSLPGLATGERAVVRAVATCAGRWYVTGAIAAADGTPRPAAWTSADARTWSPVRVAGRTYYGKLNTLYLAGCHDGTLAAVGAKSGGAHGFFRYSTWYADATGTLIEVEVPYTLFAGPDGVDVLSMAAGAPGWALTGNRVTGAAAWRSADGRTFALDDPAPPLASGAGHTTWAAAVAATPAGWVIAGAVTDVRTMNRDPAVWTSTDGRNWRSVHVAGTPAFEDPQRVAVSGSSVVMVGPRAGGYGVWRGGASGGWALVGYFGNNGAGSGSATGLTATGGHLWATASDATAFQAWESDDLGTSWRAVALPEPAPARVDTVSVVVADDRQLLLVIDDGQASRLWLDAGAAGGR